MTESALLGIAGAVLGVLTGVWGSRLIAIGLQGQLAPWVRFDLDAPVLLFVGLATVATVCLTGLVPALYSVRSAASHSFHRTTAGRSRLRLLGSVTSVQVALSLAMLVVGATIADDFRHLVSTDPGVAPNDLMTFQVSMSGSSVQTREERVEFAYALEEALGSDRGRFLGRRRLIPAPGGQLGVVPPGGRTFTRWRNAEKALRSYSTRSSRPDTSKPWGFRFSEAAVLTGWTDEKRAPGSP